MLLYTCPVDRSSNPVGGKPLVEDKSVDTTERLAPMAPVGTGGIGKASTALATPHNNYIEELFGENFRFIHYDQFISSFAPPPIWGHRCGYQEPRGCDSLATVLILEGNAHSPR